MKKSELITAIKEIGETHKIKKEVVEEILNLFRSKKESQRIEIEKDGILYKNCRFTDRLWPLYELVYQNEEKKREGKDKGYSKIGISLWNKGQKYIKDLQEEITNRVLEGKDPSKLAKELKEIKDKNLGNNPEWLSQFLTDEQKEEVETKSLPLPKK